MNFKKLVIFVFIVLVIILGIQIYKEYADNHPLNTVCNYNDSGKIYIKKDPGCPINFLCTVDKVPFSDECGCGCALKKDNSSEPKRNNCTAEQKSAEVCYELYQPVCGWFNKNIECIKFPCADTYTNECFACKDPKVDYWTSGECPK